MDVTRLLIGILVFVVGFLIALRAFKHPGLNVPQYIVGIGFGCIGGALVATALF